MRKITASWIVTVIAAACLLAPAALAEEQPHMRAALEHLKQAQAELQQAEHDKGGHREAALKQVDGAIRNVQAGMNFDNKHDKDKDKDHDKDKDRR